MKKNNHLTQAQLTDQISAVLKTHSQAGAFFLLALSGGVDSVVLLHALCTIKQKWPFQLHALHVHHGLSQFADDWAQHCQQMCASLGVPLHVVKVSVDRAAKLGIEAEARKLRYQALFDYRDGERAPDFILTAHHEQDQAETLLLQLSRGAGVKGLAGMAVVDEGRKILRPMLATPKTDIFAYAKKHALNWCEDESNENTAFERNFLRHEILPVWEKRLTAIYKNVARSAAHLAQADALLDALAKIDSEHLLDKNSICLAGLKKLETARVKNVLRWWLGHFGIAMPNTEYLNEIVTQLLLADADANVHLNLDGFVLKCFQQRAFLLQIAEAAPLAFEFTWQGEAHIALPHGELYFKHGKGADLLRMRSQDQLTIRFRHGGERIKTAKNRPARTLKYLMQEKKIPPWERTTWPLIYLNGSLVCAPNIGVAHDLQTQENQAGIEITYQPKTPFF